MLVTVAMLFSLVFLGMHEYNMDKLDEPDQIKGWTRAQFQTLTGKEAVDGEILKIKEFAYTDVKTFMDTCVHHSSDSKQYTLIDDYETNKDCHIPKTISKDTQVEGSSFFIPTYICYCLSMAVVLADIVVHRVKK